MPTAVDSARKTLTDRLLELEAEAKRLASEREQIEKALGALGASAKASVRSRASSASASRAGASKRSTRAPRGQRRAQVLEHLKAASPARPADIAKALDVSQNQVHGLLAKLRKEKLVKKGSRGYSLTAAAKPNDG